MRKLLNLVFAIWKSGRLFNPDWYPWQTPAHVEASDNGMSQQQQATDNGMSQQQQTAGHKPDAVPAQPVVAAACADMVAEGGSADESTHVDFAHVKRQLSLARV